MELNKIRLWPWILVLLLCAAMTAYGAYVENGGLLASSLSVGTILLFLIPALNIRNRKIQRVKESAGVLLHWQYAPHEMEDIAQERYHAVRKTSIRVSILLSVCMAIVFLPLVLHSMQPQSDLVPMLPYMTAAVLLPFLAVPLAPAMAANRVRRAPCITCVGRDYVLIANHYIGLNDRYMLNAEQVEVEENKAGRMRLRVQYSFQAGRILRTFTKWVDIPVPFGKEEEAYSFVNGWKEKNEEQTCDRRLKE